MAKIYMATGTRIARMASESTVLDQAAMEVRQKAEAIAKQHVRTGKYSGNFRVGTAPGTNGVIDRYVYNDHPAALFVEYGHFAHRKDGAEGQWVPGKFPLLRAIGQVG